VKGAGIGQDCDIEVGGNLAGKRSSHLLDQVIDHLASGCSFRIHPVIRPKSSVADVVVDIDHQTSGCHPTKQPAQPPGIRGIHGKITIKGTGQPVRLDHLTCPRQAAQVLRNRIWVKGHLLPD
jgi:hypothetical protein